MGLNHIYKVIWSKTKCAWVVVSELAKREGKSSVKSMLSANGMRSAVACMVVMALGCGTAWGATTFYGQGAATIGLNATSIGSNARGLSEQSIAIGHDSLARDQYTIAIGGSAVLNGAIGIGIGANANNTESIALGRHARALADQSIAVGKSADTRADKAIAIGLSSGGNATSSIAIGEMATTLVGSNNSIAMGSSAQTKAEAAIAIGKGTLASHEYSVALGNSAKATQLGAISMGHGAQAGHSHTIAIGTGAKATQLTGIAMGQNVVVNKPGSIGIGTNTTMDNTGVNSISIGRGNTVNAGNVVALGNYITANADVAGAVVLGNGSSPTGRATLSDVTISNTTFKASNYAGNVSNANKGDIVSVGNNGSERQIKHVGAGVISATSTDAVNGSQLYHVANDILATPLKFDGDSGETLTPVLGNTVNIKGSIASGVTTTDGNIAIVGDNTTKTLTVKMAKELSGLTSANFTDAAGNTTVVNGGGVTITPIGGGNAISVTTGGINAGSKEIKGVATGTTNDAAVNKGQLDAAISGVTAGATSTETVVAATAPTGDTNLATVTGQTGTAKGETYEVFVSENAVKTAAQTAATNVVNNVTNTVNALGANTITLGADSNSTTAQALNKTGGLQFNIKGDSGANALISTSAAGDTVTVSPTAKLTNAVAAAENAADKDLSNITPAGETVIKNLATTTVNNTITKAVADADHDFGGDTGTKVTRKHGEQLDIKGGVTNTADLTTGNIGVVTDPSNGALNVRLAKVLNGLTSASFTDAAGNSTVVNGGGVTITPIGGGNAISVTTGGINAGGKEIKGIATGTTNDAAVNKGQLEAAITTALSNISGGAISTESVVAAAPTAGDTNLVTVTTQTGTKIGETYAVSVSGNAVKALATQAANQAINATNLNIAGDNTTGSVNVGTGVLKVAGSNGVETVANGSTITVGLDAATRNKIDNAATNAANGANKDLSNISPAGQQVIKDTAAWNMKVNGNAAETIKGGDTVTFNNGSNIEITQVGKDITVATKQDVTFNTITGVSTITGAGAGAGAPSISFNNPSGGTPSISVNAPIDMNGKTITNLADGVNPTDAVNKQQLDNAIIVHHRITSCNTV